MLSKLPDIILLDLDNTVYSYKPCHEWALEKVELYTWEAVGLSNFREVYDMARKEVHIRLAGTASSHNRLLYFQRLLELSEHGINISLAAKLYELYWNSFIEHVDIFDGVYKFLECAKRLGIPVALVTDLTADVQFKKIAKFNMENLIDVLVTSEEAGKDKPDRAIFDIALEKAGCKRESIWMIGDSLSKDIAGGKSVGAVTFLKVNKNDKMSFHAELTPDHVFESFYELVDILTN